MPKNVPVKDGSQPVDLQSFSKIKEWVSLRSEALGRWAQANWFRLLIIGLLTFILLRKDVSLQLDLQNGQAALPLEEWAALIAVGAGEDPVTPVSNAPVLSAEQNRQSAYVKRFAKVAQKEMEAYGIPASITLAQGLLETNAGESPLATKNNNHFGLKCFSRTCTKGHCTNFSDDSHKDFFRKYNSAWESYRAHSQLLSDSERYKFLFSLPKTDYKGWASGLRRAGYATDQRYGEKLVRLIENLQLYEYDV